MNNKPLQGNQQLQQLLTQEFYINTVTEDCSFFNAPHQISVNLSSGSYPESSNNMHKQYLLLFESFTKVEI